MADKVLRETVMKDDKGNEAKVYIGVDPKVYGPNSLRIGELNSAIEGSIANGYSCSASGNKSHAEGEYTNASGSRSHAEGRYTVASGNCSHAEGFFTTANGGWSHAEGASTTASGNYSHAEGYQTNAIGEYSHAEGYKTNAIGPHSHAEGSYTTAEGENQLVIGRFNNPNTSDLFQVGCGTGSNHKQNAFSIDEEGNAHIYKGLILEEDACINSNEKLSLGNNNGVTIINPTDSNATSYLNIQSALRYRDKSLPIIFGIKQETLNLSYKIKNVSNNTETTVKFPSNATLLKNKIIDPEMKLDNFKKCITSTTTSSIDLTPWMENYHKQLKIIGEHINNNRQDYADAIGEEDISKIGVQFLLQQFNGIYPVYFDSSISGGNELRYPCYFQNGDIFFAKDYTLVEDVAKIKIKTLEDINSKMQGTPYIIFNVLYYKL